MSKEITQKLGFSAGGALRSLTNVKNRLDAATASLIAFKDAGGQIGAGAQGMNKVAGATDKAKNKANEFSLSWQTIGRILQTQVMLRGINSITKALGEGVENARQLGLRVAEIQTIGGQLGMTSEDMTRKIISASSEIAGVSAAQFAEGIYQTLSNQVVEVGKAFDFTRESAVLAKVTMSETKDAVNALSSVMNSYQMGAEQAKHVSDTLFATVEFGRLRLAELANILGRVTPLAAELGIKWEEVAASTAVMTTQGTRADTSLTQLRAVISALLKPSDDLKAIYEKWGVRDSKAAIAAFGGLGGVLEKLKHETGGSSAEMADLLKNVRAISGFFGMMTEEGTKLEDILEKITNATGKLETAWQTFKGEGAQVLSKEMETYENTLTQIATDAMPAITAWWQMKNLWAKTALVLARHLNGQYTREAKIRQKIAETMAKGTEEIKAEEEALARANRKDWQKRLQQMNLYYTEINKQEMKLQRIRENGMETAKTVFEDAGKRIVDIFGEAKKELEDWIKMAKDANKTAAKDVAEIEKKITGKKLERKLADTPDRMKLGVFEQEFAAQQRKVTDAFGRIDKSKESKERALAEAEILESMVGQGIELARQQGHQATINKWLDRDIGVLRQQQEIHKLSAQEQEKAIPAAEKRLSELGVEESKLKSLMKAYTEKRMMLSEVRDPDARKILEDEIAELKTQMEKIFKDVNLGMAFFESLGIGENLNLLSTELETALNTAEKDWEAEYQRMRAVFTREEIPLRIMADRTGLIERAGTVFGMEKSPDQTTTEFNQQVLERAAEVQKNWRDGQLKIKETQQEINNAQEAANLAYRETAEWINTEGVEWEEMLGKKRVNLDLVRNYQNALQEAIQTVKEGNQLTTEQKHTLTELKNIAILHNKPLKEQLEVLDAIVPALETALQKEQKLKELRETTPTQEFKVAADDATYAAEVQARELEKVSDKSGLARDQQIKIAATLRSEVLPATQQVAQQTGNVATQAGNATSNAALYEQAVGLALPRLSTAVGYALQLAGAMERAASASQQVNVAGGAAAQYHGGPMKYFAHGGRGQDKIPAMLTKKETVVSAKNSQRFFSELNAMNQGSQPVYREQGGTVTNVGDVNVTVQGGDSSQQTVREIGRALRREVQRGTIKLR